MAIRPFLEFVAHAQINLAMGVLAIMSYRVHTSRSLFRFRLVSPLNPPILGDFERFGSPKIGG
jgi:hypothetical protein